MIKIFLESFRACSCGTYSTLRTSTHIYGDLFMLSTNARTLSLHSLICLSITQVSRLALVERTFSFHRSKELKTSLWRIKRNVSPYFVFHENSLRDTRVNGQTFYPTLDARYRRVISPFVSRLVCSATNERICPRARVSRSHEEEHFRIFIDLPGEG